MEGEVNKHCCCDQFLLLSVPQNRVYYHNFRTDILFAFVTLMLRLMYRLVQKYPPQSLTNHHFATVSNRVMQFSPKCSEIIW